MHADKCITVLLSLAFAAHASACRFQGDSVLSGAYGPDQSQAGTTASMSGAQTTSPTRPANGTTVGATVPNMGSPQAGNTVSSGAAGMSGAAPNTKPASNTSPDASTSMGAAGAMG